MRYLSLAEVLVLHERIIAQSGGAAGLRDLGSLESALAQPRATFDGNDLYPSLVEKAAALAHSLIGNHPFVDGNKRIGHAALEVFLLLNGFELAAPADEAERVFLSLAAGITARSTLTAWVQAHLRPRQS
jgi:death on curing protein